MIRKGDIQWWVLEARKYPESAPIAIEALAGRLIELDAENESLRNEVLRLQQRAPAETSSAEAQSLRAQVEKLQYLLKSQALTEPIAILLSDQLNAGRIPLSEVRKMVYEVRAPLDNRAMLQLQGLLVAQPHDELQLLTSQGRGIKQMMADIPLLVESGSWPSGPSPLLSQGERITTAVAFSQSPRFWTMVTRKGFVQRFVRVAFEREMAKGDPLLKGVLDRDEAVALVNGDRGDLVVVTRWGQANRFSQRVIDVQGSLALDLEEGDEVTGALSLPDEGEILIVTAGGYAARRSTADLPTRAKPGNTPGKKLIQARDVLTVTNYSAEDWLLFLTYSGRLILLPTADIPLLDRLGKGTSVEDMQRDPAAAVALIPGSML